MKYAIFIRVNKLTFILNEHDDLIKVSFKNQLGDLMTGMFIVVEGGDRSGKSTLVNTKR